jgi:hypothetical protein
VGTSEVVITRFGQALTIFWTAEALDRHNLTGANRIIRTAEVQDWAEVLDWRNIRKCWTGWNIRKCRIIRF